jgi:hypothetical protein
MHGLSSPLPLAENLVSCFLLKNKNIKHDLLNFLHPCPQQNYTHLYEFTLVLTSLGISSPFLQFKLSTFSLIPTLPPGSMYTHACALDQSLWPLPLGTSSTVAPSLTYFFSFSFLLDSFSPCKHAQVSANLVFLLSPIVICCVPKSQQSLFSLRSSPVMVSKFSISAF